MFRRTILTPTRIITATVIVTLPLSWFGGEDSGTALAAPSPKLAICHRTGSTKKPWLQKTVSQNAVPAHLAHGDFVVSATNVCPPPPCTTNDTIVDADGTESPGIGGPGARRTTCGATLTAFPATANSAGLSLIDNDGSGFTWTAGDALIVEGPTFCSTAVSDNLFTAGSDCVVLDSGGSLVGGESVACNLQVDSAGCGLKFFDANNNGAWDNGEDIVLDGNNNNLFD